MRPPKIVFIGAGSMSFGAQVFRDIFSSKQLMGAELWLVDIDPVNLARMFALAKRFDEQTGMQIDLHATEDRREALPGADFVTTQFRVGLLNARIKDERIPLSYGMLGQETNGAGGMFKAFRTIPVILGIIEDMKELCPDAWLINFTNPSGMVTEAAIKWGGWKKTVGLCNVPVGALMKEPPQFGLTERECIHQFAGLNHFHWHKVTDAKGNDLTDKIISNMYDPTVDDGTPANIFQCKFLEDHLRQIQLIPCGYHRYYYMHDEMLKHTIEEFNTVGTRAQQVKQTEAELFELYKDPNLNYKPEQLSKRGGAHYSDAACECINSIYNDTRRHMVVSTQNNGAIRDLPDDCIVEVSSIITGKGPIPLAWGKFAPSERGWLQLMKAMEECVIEAAITGNYRLALAAFEMNPMVEHGHVAQTVLDELLVAHEKYLPQFADKIAELKAKGVMPKDPVVLDLMAQGL